MVLDAYDFLILACVIVVVSYLFNIISEWLKIPSVILLIGAGLVLQKVSAYYSLVIPELRTLLEFVGVLGLILIVLEGTLDLKITKEKRPTIVRALVAALGVLLATSGCITCVLHFYNLMDWRIAFVYAIPMGIISSSIAIPSVVKLNPSMREFIIYESTFSDIVGIMLFNYAIADELLSWNSTLHFFWSLLLILLLSFGSTGLLLLLFKYLKGHVKVFLILALLMLMYALGKGLHLPSLLLILIFGLVINNIQPYLTGRLKKYLHPEKLNAVTNELKIVTGELAFVIRTFFFLLFGFSIDVSVLLSFEVIITGSLIVLGILFMRYIFFKFVTRTNIFPEILIAPRGLISIILFYSIPDELITGKFDEGVLTFVIIVSSIIMMVGILFSKKSFIVEDNFNPVI